jgi:hypothetical protein
LPVISLHPARECFNTRSRRIQSRMQPLCTVQVSAASALGLFLLPGGLPRLFVAVIQAGGRPRFLPWPRASRSKTMIASSTCSRSVRNSASILLISISGKDSAREGLQISTASADAALATARIE